ncbi:helix-turn-helix domain-containing protein [Ferrimonas balearica]|uniref:helix-turn-helix transcriptional regulator n=1 Tax=Ferrimonas balearica TaxID=44012 RepID=UPI001C974E1D|nr:helix-turn-helix domain-containing protein [Ferrimonas balearica]
MKVAEIVKSARTKAGLSQAALGEMVGAERVTVSRWESGARSPHAAQLVRLLEVCGVQLQKALEGEGADAR